MKKTLIITAIALTATAGLTLNATAAVYKCTDANGKVEFSDKPCAGADSKPMALDHNVIEGKATETSSQTTPDTSKPSAQNAPGAAEAPSPPKRPGRADERRFIRNGMNAAEVRARIGSPDAREDGACRERVVDQQVIRDLCEDCWVYYPAVGDPQTRTQVCFLNGQVSSIERKIER